MEKNIFDIAMIGGGLDSFMGPIHLKAIAKAGNVQLVSGTFGSTRKTTYDCQIPYGLKDRKIYGAYREFFRAQSRLPKEDRVLFVSTPLPNTMHYPVAMASMDAGIPVLGEKPFTCNIDEAANLVRKSKAVGVPYRIAMVYPAYSMLKKARELIKDGRIGIVRRVIISMQLGWMAPRVENKGNRQALWRTDARKNGMGGVVNDLSSNCQFVMEYVTGCQINEACAVGHACVPGRLIPDDAVAMVRTEQGIPGVFLLSQVATGHREGLVFEIWGDKGSMRWWESAPGKLVVLAPTGEQQVYSDDNSALGAPGGVSTPFGGSDAYVEALARVYRDYADELSGKTKPAGRVMGMTLEEGLRSVAVIEAITKSMQPPREGEPPVPKWIPVVIPNV